MLQKNYYLYNMDVDIWIVHRFQFFIQENLLHLSNIVKSCSKCNLHKVRNKVVISKGSAKAKIMIIGEAPGFHEDKLGLPFVGRSGILLHNMLSSIGLQNRDVYITNILKCRPPENRNPTLIECEKCSNYLYIQIKLVNPNIILILGTIAGKFLTGYNFSMRMFRKKIFFHKNIIPMIITYHPAYLLRNPIYKKQSYMDIQIIKNYL